MKLNLKESPRVFNIGELVIKDFGQIQLENNDLITLNSEGTANKNYDIVAKDWGYYATPSINQRLVNEGFKTAIIVNQSQKLFIVVVDMDKMSLFEEYVKNANIAKVIWIEDLKLI